MTGREWYRNHDEVVAAMADINARMVHRPSLPVTAMPVRQPIPKRNVRTDEAFVRLMALLGMFAFVFVLAFIAATA